MKDFLRDFTYTWVSTCNWSHTTTFPGDWTLAQMANWVADKNFEEGNVRPLVTIAVHPGML